MRFWHADSQAARSLCCFKHFAVSVWCPLPRSASCVSTAFAEFRELAIKLCARNAADCKSVRRTRPRIVEGGCIWHLVSCCFCSLSLRGAPETASDHGDLMRSRLRRHGCWLWCGPCLPRKVLLSRAECGKRSCGVLSRPMTRCRIRWSPGSWLGVINWCGTARSCPCAASIER